MILIIFMIFESYTNNNDLLKNFKEKTFKVWRKIGSKVDTIINGKNSANNDNISGLEMGVEFINKMKKQETDVFEDSAHMKNLEKKENKEFLLLLLINNNDDLKDLKFSDLEIYRKEISKFESDEKLEKTLKIVFKFVHKKEFICQKFIWEKKKGISKLKLHKKEKSRFIKEALSKCDFKHFLGEELLLSEKNKDKKINHFHNTKKTIIHKKNKNGKEFESKKKTEAYYNDGKHIKKEKNIEIENKEIFNDKFGFKKVHNRVRKNEHFSNDGNGNFSTSHHVVESFSNNYETSSFT